MRYPLEKSPSPSSKSKLRENKVPIFQKLEGEERKEGIEESGKSRKRWVREDLARYWYVILCLFVDVVFNLQFVETYSRFGGEVNLILVVVSFPVLIPVVYIEYLIYRRLFPDRF